MNRHYWCAHVSENGTIYAVGRVDGRLVRLHRWLMGEPDGQVDHRDRDSLNNQKGNLRVATNQQNSANKSPTPGKFKGVQERNGRYRTTIMFNYKSMSLGTYATAEEAARAYDTKAKELFGEFACLNFPEDIGGSEVGSN